MACKACEACESVRRVKRVRLSIIPSMVRSARRICGRGGKEEEDQEIWQGGGHNYMLAGPLKWAPCAVPLNSYETLKLVALLGRDTSGGR